MSDLRKVMVIDRSGRGHAVADLFVRTNKDVEVLYVPGCQAISHDRIRSFTGVTLADTDAIVDIAKKEKVDFVFVANTAALANGFVDRLRAEGIQAIGPDKAASQLEASKAYAKGLCAKYGIPVADFAIFDDAEKAKEHVRSVGYDVVVKADGLCGGNGSYVCNSVNEAEAAIKTIMVDKEYGGAGDKVVVERKLPGIEISFFALFDGKTFTPLPMALDYKRADDGNIGVNGGGMGSLSPHPLEGDRLNELMQEQVLVPLAKCIQGEGLNYNGVIYVGAMLSEGKVNVLEFNVRLGDPEAEVVLPRIETDFVQVCDAIMQQNLHQIDLKTDPRFFCNVVATQGRTRQVSSTGRNKGWYRGWPYGRYGKGYQITGLDQVDANQARVFIGEAADHPERGLVSDGGRVIHVVGMGDKKQEAVDFAYANVRRVQFEGVRFRTDIGLIYNDQRVLSEAEIRSALDSATPPRAAGNGAKLDGSPKRLG